MPDAQPHTAFLDELDRKLLDTINERIAKLEPIVSEYNELVRRRRILEQRRGLNRTSEKVVNLLAEYPEGLTAPQMGEILDMHASTVRSTCSDLVAKNMLTRFRPGLYGYVTTPFAKATTDDNEVDDANSAA